MKPETFTVWSIRYTDKRDGSKHWYMNIGFDSAWAAENELRILKREQKKWKEMGTFNERITVRGCYKIIPRKLTVKKK